MTFGVSKNIIKHGDIFGVPYQSLQGGVLIHGETASSTSDSCVSLADIYFEWYCGDTLVF